MPYIGTRQSLRTDNYLTNLSVQTAQRDSVADFVAPPVKVKQDTGRYRIYSRINTHRTLADQISKGMKPRQIETNYTYGTYELGKYGLSDYVADEDERNAEGTDLMMDTLDAIRTLHLLARENRTATNALAALTASGMTGVVPALTKWNLPAGTPITQITQQKIVAMQATQENPNAIVTTPEVALGVTLTTEWRNYFTPTFQRALFDPIAGLRNLGLEPKLAGMCELTSLQGTASDPDEFARVWVNTAVLFVRKPGATIRTNAFMFSPNLYQDRVRTARGEEEMKRDADYVEIKSERTNLVINNQAGWYFNAPN